MHRKTELLVWVAALFWMAQADGQPLGQEHATGVVVEGVEAGQAAAKAGLRPGDEILSWSFTAEPGPTDDQIRSPFGLLEVEFEQGSRGDVTLSGLRESRQMTWLLPRGSWWRITTRPGFPSRTAELYRAGKEKIAAGDLAGGEALWRTAVSDLTAAGDRLSASWLLERSAARLAKAEKWDEADTAYEEALEILGVEAPPWVAAHILIDWGESSLNHSAWDRAADHFERALVLQRKVGSQSLVEPEILVALGDTAWYKGNLATAEEFHRQAMKIYEERAPRSLNTASALNNWANVLVDQGDLDRAEQDLRSADEILRQVDPGAVLHGEILSNLGCVMWFRGDLAAAEGLFRQALAIYEKWNADSDHILRALNNLAEVAGARGDLAASEDLLLRSLHLVEAKGNDQLELVDVLGSLGRVAMDRGDLDVAEKRFRRSLEVAEALVPDSPKLAEALESFAGLARRRGQYGAARDALRRAFAIQERQGPGSFHLAEPLVQLAAVELANGDVLAAEGGFRRARDLLESQVPDSPSLAEALQGLGDVAARRGESRQAIELYRQAVRQQEKTGADTAFQARLLHTLGKAERSAGLAEEGRRHLCEALDVLDRQRRKLGGTGEVRATFEASNRDIYNGCLEALLAEERATEAFATLERGRARSFLDLLAERDLEISGLAPETAAERRRIDEEYDRLQSKILTPAPNAPAGALEELQGKLRELRVRQEQLTARIRRESPRFASLRYPEPLALAGARTALDPGTVLLEYAVGPERAWLFVVRAADVPGPGLSVFPVAAGEKSLRKEVESLRRLLKRPGSDRAALRARARRLYGLLVRPAEREIAGARRLLISPDGPLHTLPFATLMRGDRYLVEWKPIHSVLSATVYAELGRSRPARQDLRKERLDAFGDPSYPRSTPGLSTDPEVRDARRGWALRPLPSTRKEVEAIAALYPQGRAYLGREATEEKAKSLGPESRLVHFACHGLLDERFPLNSALALTLPEHPAAGQDNGLLQAWEIFESVRLDADLVTLSACDTALGREMGGEGLVGLTRAFQYAGARSVLASLWGVADFSTARFMKSFYGYLRNGKPKDEALRAAQIDQIRKQGGSSHPFFWAAFELSGDWR